MRALRKFGVISCQPRVVISLSVCGHSFWRVVKNSKNDCRIPFRTRMREAGLFATRANIGVDVSCAKVRDLFERATI